MYVPFESVVEAVRVNSDGLADEVIEDVVDEVVSNVNGNWANQAEMVWSKSLGILKLVRLQAGAVVEVDVMVVLV